MGAGVSAAQTRLRDIAATRKEGRLPAFSEHDRPLLERLHQLVFGDAQCNAAVEQALRRAAGRFSEPQFSKAYSSVAVPVELFDSKLPGQLRGEVRLCRAFSIKAGQRAPHEEIHRNSIQRLVSYRGSGIVNCAKPGGIDGAYEPRRIVSPDSDEGKEISSCWDVVPENTWHFPQATGPQQWLGVAFHSAAADEIEDEYIAWTG
jgi:hypothetical protein